MYELEADFNELFEPVKLDSNDGAIWVARSPTAHEDVLEVASIARTGEVEN